MFMADVLLIKKILSGFIIKEIKKFYVFLEISRL